MFLAAPTEWVELKFVADIEYRGTYLARGGVAIE
jgi:hypothetical protein